MCLLPTSGGSNHGMNTDKTLTQEKRNPQREFPLGFSCRCLSSVLIRVNPWFQVTWSLPIWSIIWGRRIFITAGRTLHLKR